MSFNRILIPVDGSAYSDKAIETGIELAKIADSEITLYFVMDRSLYLQTMGGANFSDIESVMGEEKKNILTPAREKLEAAGVKFGELVSEGIPGKEICEKSADFDLIIMGTAGRTGIKKVIMGSVTQMVVANARCPVMSVKITE